jgi:hypothetical protein
MDRKWWQDCLRGVGAGIPDVPVADASHLERCPFCGQMFDTLELGQVLEHYDHQRAAGVPAGDLAPEQDKPPGARKAKPFDPHLLRKQAVNPGSVSCSIILLPWGRHLGPKMDQAAAHARLADEAPGGDGWVHDMPIHPASSCSVDDLPAQSPPWPPRSCGSLLGDCSLRRKGILPGPLGRSSVNLAHSSGNPLSKWQVGFESNFDGISIKQGVGNLDLSFPGGAAGPCPPPTPTCPSSDKAWR